MTRLNQLLDLFDVGTFCYFCYFMCFGSEQDCTKNHSYMAQRQKIGLIDQKIILRKNKTRNVILSKSDLWHALA